MLFFLSHLFFVGFRFEGSHFRYPVSFFGFFDGWSDGRHSDAASVMAAVAVANGNPRLSALKESPFLPSVSGETRRIY